MYAPVDVDRSLYVFGCNSVGCTETPGSWRVLRDQGEAVVVEADALPSVDAEALAPEPEEKRSAWDAGDDSDDSDWGDNDNDDSGDADDPFDLEKLLLQRDDAMSAAASTTATASKKSKQSARIASHSSDTTTNTATVTQASHENVFPARLIEVIDEPYEDYASENDYSHENALLEDYMTQEEEEKSTDVGDLRKLLSSSKKGKQVGAGGSKASSSSGESYEKTPAQQRHFMRFQKRISRCPLQCLRYDYGGEPLWPAPKPQSLKVPKCVCGAERVFELQLTPTINYFLKVDQFASPIAAPPAAPSSAPVVVSGSPSGDDDDDDDNDDETSAAVLATATAKKKTATVGPSAAPPASAGGGMDWLSVVVYCCPKSCSRSREEFVFVLPAEKA